MPNDQFEERFFTRTSQCKMIFSFFLMHVVEKYKLMSQVKCLFSCPAKKHHGTNTQCSMIVKIMQGFPGGPPADAKTQVQCLVWEIPRAVEQLLRASTTAAPVLWSLRATGTGPQAPATEACTPRTPAQQREATTVEKLVRPNQEQPPTPHNQRKTCAAMNTQQSKIK